MVESECREVKENKENIMIGRIGVIGRVVCTIGRTCRMLPFFGWLYMVMGVVA